jgi:hypothetical protein
MMKFADVSGVLNASIMKVLHPDDDNDGSKHL